MPSSLTRVLSSALGFSPFLPVSVSGTGSKRAPHAAFLGSMESTSLCARKHVLISSRNCHRVCVYRLLRRLPTGLNRYPLPGWPILLRPCLLQRLSYWCRNINLLAIDYAVRPRLRSRLTLGGRAWPRNPWDFGGQDSHLSYRYSCLHLHFCTLQPPSSVDLHCKQNAPLPLFRVRSFGIQLSPGTSSAQVH